MTFSLRENKGVARNHRQAGLRSAPSCCVCLALPGAQALLQGYTSFVWALAFCLDVAMLASSSGDATVRLWGTAPLKTRYQARRKADAVRPEAVRLVGRLLAELREPTLVVSRLREDGSVSAPLRRAVLREVLRQGGR